MFCRSSIKGSSFLLFMHLCVIRILKYVSQVIELPIKHPELFESLGIAQPKVKLVSSYSIWLNLLYRHWLLVLVSKSTDSSTIGCSAVWATWYRENTFG